MIRKPPYAIILLLMAAAFLAGQWYSRKGNNSSAASGGRRVLYYHDPMHPAYKSDKPGIAPDCGMQLEPVYADGRRRTRTLLCLPELFKSARRNSS